MFAMKRPLDLLAADGAQDRGGGHALVDVEAHGVYVEARVLGLAGPDELRVHVRVVRVRHALRDRAALRGDPRLRDVGPVRVQVAVVADAAFIDRHAGGRLRAGGAPAGRVGRASELEGGSRHGERGPPVGRRRRLLHRLERQVVVVRRHPSLDLQPDCRSGTLNYSKDFRVVTMHRGQPVAASRTRADPLGTCAPLRPTPPPPDDEGT